MAARKGFTLLEIIAVLVIIGVLVAIAIPNFFTYIERTKAQTAQNNLLAISAAEERLSEDNGGVYCTSSCSSQSSIITSLHLTMSTSGSFGYDCSHPASPYECIASDGIVTLTLNPSLNPVVSCSSSNNSNCPLPP